MLWIPSSWALNLGPNFLSFWITDMILVTDSPHICLGIQWPIFSKKVSSWTWIKIILTFGQNSSNLIFLKFCGRFCALDLKLNLFMALFVINVNDKYQNWSANWNIFMVQAPNWKLARVKKVCRCYLIDTFCRCGSIRYPSCFWVFYYFGKKFEVWESFWALSKDKWF